MSFLFVMLLACSGDDPEPNDTDTDTTDTDTDTDTDTGVLTADSSPTTPTAETGTTGTPPTGDTAGTPTGDTGPALLTGRAYRFDPASLNVVRPPVPVYFYDSIALLEIVDHDIAADTIDVRIATFDPNTNGQDACVPTNDVLGVDLSTAPDVVIGPADGVMGLYGNFAPMEEATVELTFDATYDAVVAASLTGLVDTAPLGNAYGYGPAFYCDTLGGYYAIACVPCPTSGSPYCLPWEANSGRARLEAALSLVERTVADVQGDPACN